MVPEHKNDRFGERTAGREDEGVGKLDRVPQHPVQLLELHLGGVVPLLPSELLQTLGGTKLKIQAIKKGFYGLYLKSGFYILYV